MKISAFTANAYSAISVHYETFPPHIVGLNQRQCAFGIRRGLCSPPLYENLG